MYETLQFDERGEMATITLLRSRINVKQIRELERVCDHLEDVSKAKVVVLRGHSEDRLPRLRSKRSHGHPWFQQMGEAGQSF